MASLTLAGVRKSYRKGVEIVRGIDLHIADGELVSLVGASGSGKSTLLNLIAGLETPTAGTISLDGVDVTQASPRERDIALVFQSYALYPHLDVRQNLEFPLRVAQLDRAEIDKRVKETAARLQLSQYLERKPGELSGGQRQRVALGRALVRRPKLFLFDEPLSNLDAGLRTQMRIEIKKLHEELKATFVYVTHDQAEAMTLSDRVAVLEQGVLAQVAPPLEIYNRPYNRFVATFVGAPKMNLLPGATLELPHPQVGIRPEHVRLSLTPQPGWLEGRVYMSEPLGAETWVTFERNGVSLTGRTEGSNVPASDSPIWFNVSPENVHVFDEQGLRK